MSRDSYVCISSRLVIWWCQDFRFVLRPLCLCSPSCKHSHTISANLSLTLAGLYVSLTVLSPCFLCFSVLMRLALKNILVRAANLAALSTFSGLVESIMIWITAVFSRLVSLRFSVWENVQAFALCVWVLTRFLFPYVTCA